MRVSSLRSRLSLATTIALVLTAAGNTSSAARKSLDRDVHKTIKTVITAIRYKKDDMAAKKIAWLPMTKAIMQDDWNRASPKQQGELVAGVEHLVRKASFAKGRSLFKHLDTIAYGSAEEKGDKVLCRATIVVHNKAVKKEIVLDFVLIKEDGVWKIFDTIIAGESTSAGIHEDQIEDLMDDGGVEAVLKALRTKLATL